MPTPARHGYFYATPRSRLEEFLSQGHPVLLNLDVQGGSSLRREFNDGVFIFILPPSVETLRDRLNHRATDPAAVVEAIFNYYEKRGFAPLPAERESLLNL